MSKKLPPDAFEAYFALGQGRSYDAIAKKYGVAKRTVTRAADAHDWQGRIKAAEEKARVASDQKIAETLEAMRERHLNVLRVIQRKALLALQAMPLDTAYQAVRALTATIEQERLVRGEPTERSALDVEAIIKREYATLFLKPGEQDWPDA